VKKLDKLILRSFTGPFLLTLAVVVFILLLHMIIRYLDDFVGKGLGASVFAELLFYFSLTTTPTAFPLAILLASLIAFGSLGEHAELTAIKSSGISLIRVLAPVFVFTIGLTLAAFWFSNTIVPKASMNTFSLLWDVRRKKPALDIKEGVFYNGLQGYSIKIRQKLPDGTMLGLLLYDHRDRNGNSEVTLADTAKMYAIHNDRYLVLELTNGSRYADFQPESRQDKFWRDTFRRSQRIIDLSSFDLSRTDKAMFASHRIMKNVQELQQASDSMQWHYQQMQINARQLAEQYYPYRRPATAPPELRSDWLDTLRPGAYPLPDRQQTRNVKTFVQTTLSQTEAALREARIYAIEKHTRYAQAVACLIMFLIGAPVGAIVKKGGLGMPVLVSIVFFIVYYVLSLLGQNWAAEGMVAIPYGVWAADGILFGAGLFFVRQARNDSRLFDADAIKISLVRALTRWRTKQGLH
jgi:lipopolysaccharide export system permease protein